MGQADGSGVLARDGGLHGRGLAAGVQLGGVKRSAGSGGRTRFTCEEFRGGGVTGVVEVDVLNLCNSVFI